MMRAEVGEFYYNFCIEKKKLIKILILKLINVQTFFIIYNVQTSSWVTVVMGYPLSQIQHCWFVCENITISIKRLESFTIIRFLK